MILQELHVRLGLLLDEFKKDSDKAKKEAHSIEKTFAAVKSGLAALGIFSFMKAGIAELAEGEQAADRLAIKLRMMGGNWQENAEKATQYAEAMSRVTGIEDDEIIPAFTDLLNITGNYNDAMALMPDILDLAVDKKMDVAAAAEQVGRAFIGDQRALGQLGMQYGVAREDADSFGKVIGAMRQQAEGAATSQDNLALSLKKNQNVWKDFTKNVAEALAPIIRFLSGVINQMYKLADVARVVQGTVVQAFSNINILFTKGLGAFQKANRDMLTQTGKAIVDVFKETNEQVDTNTRKTVGKTQKWMTDQHKREADDYKKEEMKKLKAAEAAMKNKVSTARATEADLLNLYRQNAEKIKQLYGEQSVEYQEALAQMTEATVQAFKFQYAAGMATTTALSAGFEAMFTAIAEEGADASKAMEAFARAMGRSLLGSVAQALEAEVAKGMAFYLTNMLMAGPWGAAPVSAYSLPMLAALAAVAGSVRGMAAMMAEGGVVDRPTYAMIGERRDRVPEAVVPLNRLEDVLIKYKSVMGESTLGGGGNPVVVRVDARNSVFADSGFSENRLAKKLGDTLTRRNIIKK